MTWTNRVQNESALCVCREEEFEWKCDTVHAYKEDSGWIEPSIPTIFKADGTSIMTIEPGLEEDNKHFSQVKKITLDGQVAQMTEGQFAVTDLLAWDEESGTVYFMATRGAAKYRVS